MSDILTDAEAWLVARVKTLFGSTLRQVDSLPATLDANSLKRITSGTPGVFVIFTGGKPQPAGATNAAMSGRWVFIAATSHAGKEAPRRHGDTQQIGTYAIVARLCRGLHGQVVPGLGSLQFAGISNLFQDSTDLEGVSVYGVDFDLPMEFDPLDDPATDGHSLDNFLRYRDTVEPTEGDGGNPPKDSVDLPAP